MSRKIRLRIPDYLGPFMPEGRFARFVQQIHNKLFHRLEYVDWPYANPPEVYGYCLRGCWSFSAPADALRGNPELDVQLEELK